MEFSKVFFEESFRKKLENIYKKIYKIILNNFCKKFEKIFRKKSEKIIQKI